MVMRQTQVVKKQSRYCKGIVIAASRQIHKVHNEDSWLVESETTDDRFYKVTEDWICDCMDFQTRGGICKHLDQDGYSPMMKAEILPSDLELKTFNYIQIERIFLTSNQFKVLDVVARALGQTIAEYITDSLLSMMECDIDETVTSKLKERFSREPMMKVCQR